MTLLITAASFVFGVLLASQVDVRDSVLWLLLLAGLLAVPLLISMRRSSLAAVATVALVLGVMRVDLAWEDPTIALKAYHGSSVQVGGTVSNEPSVGHTVARFPLRVDRIRTEGAWEETAGEVLVTHSRFALLEVENGRGIQYGDRLKLEGRLEPPPKWEGFDYPAFLARQGIGTVVSFPDITVDPERALHPLTLLHDYRRDFAASLERVVPEPQASMGKALLLGIRDSLPEDLVESFRETGASHILAISGLHVGILLAMSLALSTWALGRRQHLYLLVPLLLIWFYAVVSGMSPSAIRASIMGSVYLAAMLLGRPRSVLPALGLAAAVMVAVSPEVVWSVSFQLSFAAMGGIALLAEPMDEWMRRMSADRLDRSKLMAPALRALSSTTAMTVAATVATLPLIAFYFQRVSLVGLPTTALVLPAVPGVLVTQAAAGAVGMIDTTIAKPLGWLAWLPTVYVTQVAHAMARLPVASVETGRVAHALVFAYYGALAAVYAAVVHRQRLMRWTRGLRGLELPLPRAVDGDVRWLLLPVISAGALVWAAALTLPGDNLQVTFLDVGQGDAAFVETPGGRQILVDGGPDSDRLMHLLGERMPFMDRTIELVVLTHGHADHVSGLTEALHRFEVKRILQRETELDSPPYQAWRRAVELEGAEVIEARRGQMITTDDGLLIQVVGPPETLLRGTRSDVDNASVVIRLVYGDISFLLTGDMFAEAERALVSAGAGVDSDVLKVGHHGSRSSSSDAFLAAVSPAIAVVPAGKDNSFGHPHGETLEALQPWVPDAGLFVTSDSGAVEITTDGESLWVDTER